MLVPCILVALAATQEQGSCDAPPPDATYAADPPCFFPTEFLAVPVLSVRQETHNSKVIRFGLPEGVSLSLPVSSAIVLNAPMADGKSVARPYNPISSNDQLGSFDLLVKVYPEGKASRYIDGLKPGDRVSFKQVKPNLKPFRYPFGKRLITMVAGGTGIAPMMQALHHPYPYIVPLALGLHPPWLTGIAPMVQALYEETEPQAQPQGRP